ncbi:MAG: hypothetical protein JRI93_09510 [Deltaproteobacteria bacterium]|nr:hypothetical protein [Deltaproteobacteria bacterium]
MGSKVTSNWSPGLNGDSSMRVLGIMMEFWLNGQLGNPGLERFQGNVGLLAYSIRIHLLLDNF